MSLPLDGDGFLRRECPTCEREFKWLPSTEGSESQVEPSGYFCPYCGVQAPADQFLTKDQVRLVEDVAMREFVGPELMKLKRSLGGQRGPVRIDVNVDLPPPMDDLHEPDDMMRVDFLCHPGEPLKVLEDWTRGVYCLVCGQTQAV